jgi:hypothetical protein
MVVISRLLPFAIFGRLRMTKTFPGIQVSPVKSLLPPPLVLLLPTPPILLPFSGGFDTFTH